MTPDQLRARSEASYSACVAAESDIEKTACAICGVIEQATAEISERLDTIAIEIRALASVTSR